MKTSTMANPNTGRNIKVQTWTINPKAITAAMKDGRIKSAKDISWMLLSDDESVQMMHDQDAGDSANNNFALRIFESALDWSLGIAVMNFIKMCDYRPKPFTVAASRKGDVYVISASGRTYCM